MEKQFYLYSHERESLGLKEKTLCLFESYIKKTSPSNPVSLVTYRSLTEIWRLIATITIETSILSREIQQLANYLGSPIKFNKETWFPKSFQSETSVPIAHQLDVTSCRVSSKRVPVKSKELSSSDPSQKDLQVKVNYHLSFPNLETVPRQKLVKVLSSNKAFISDVKSLFKAFRTETQTDFEILIRSVIYLLNEFYLPKKSYLCELIRAEGKVVGVVEVKPESPQFAERFYLGLSPSQLVELVKEVKLKI